MTNPGNVWSKLRHLGLIKPKTTNKRLHFTVEELNNFFTSTVTIANNHTLTSLDNLYLGDVAYNDKKFYW